MTQSDRNESSEPGTYVNYGDKILGDKIFVQARNIIMHDKSRAFSGKDRIRFANAITSAAAWITKELRYVSDQKAKTARDESKKRLKMKKK